MFTWTGFGFGAGSAQRPDGCDLREDLETLRAKGSPLWPCPVPPGSKVFEGFSPLTPTMEAGLGVLKNRECSQEQKARAVYRAIK
jgi:hypothetical protein